MPTRTINLKMVLGSKEEKAELRRALWTTHKQVNQAVAEIERILLLCRGRSYWTLNREGDAVQIEESEVTAEALVMAREAQSRNGRKRVGCDEEVLLALRQLYEQIIPSCKLDKKGMPLKGDAQTIGNSYAGPLFDPDTCRIKNGASERTCGPFAETASKKIIRLPDWITRIGKEEFDRNEPTQFKYKNSEGEEFHYRTNLARANRWYGSDEIQNLLSENKAFNKDGWKKKKENGIDAWVVEFAKKQMQLAEDPRVTIREKLWKDLGLLPIGSLFFDKKTVGNLWNRLAVRLAVAHLLSWESWNHSTRKAHEAAREKRDSIRDGCKELQENFAVLREYEAERHRILKQVALADDDRPFKVGPRALRSWPMLREEWLKSGVTAESRGKILADFQTRLRGRFGDPDLFIWLSRDGREHLWREADSLTPHVRLNVAERLLDRRKEYSLMTFADARMHPRWAMYEAPGGSNLRNYAISKSERGVNLKIPLLDRDKGGAWLEKEFTILLAPSGQLSSLEIETIGKKILLKYRSAHQDFKGMPGGAEILFDRPHMEHAERTDVFLSQKPGSVWFKLTLDVQSQAPEAWLDGRGRVASPPELHHFKTALSNKSKHTEKLKPGLRVLSIDLGIRTFASCSVFELVRGKPSKGLYFPAHDDRKIGDPQKLWAKHERSFKLALPGETPSKKELSARRVAMAEIRSLRRDINKLRDLLRLGAEQDNSIREAKVKKFLQSAEEDFLETAIQDVMFNGLGDQRFMATPQLWQEHCHKYFDEAEKAVSIKFRAWRKRTRPKPDSWQDWRDRRGYHGGKSIWMIEYLESVRRLILSWNLRGRAYGAINRQDKKQFGTVASNLLRHINHLKEDRVKSGADLIVQASRGFIPLKNGPGWVKKHEPCRVILFEDLARYRFRVDRPRRENSQLMKWNHREILAEVAMQAEIYGMIAETTAAGFSSRYLASNGSPGVRCRCLMDDDFENGMPKPYVVFETDWMLGKAKNKGFDQIQMDLKALLRPGMWVPWNGGEMFATLAESNAHPHFIHADINAAQNLQRRFWGRCGEAFRITCKNGGKEDSEAFELAIEPGKRLLGALQQMKNGGAGFLLKPARGSEFSYVMEPVGKKRTILKARKDGDGEQDDELEDALAGLDERAGASRQTFFRDPASNFFNPSHWIPSKIYWSTVKQRVWKSMSDKNESNAGERFDDDIAF